MDRYDFELRLSGSRVPNGEVLLSDLAGLSSALQELITRIGRHVVDMFGPGRSPADVERATRLRLRALYAGSTALVVGYGDPDVLPMDVGLEQETAARFWEIVTSIPSGTRPPWVTPLVARSTLSLLDSLRVGARSVEVRRSGGAAVKIETHLVPREPWIMEEDSATETVVSVTGRLEAVDLKSSRFRIRDDVGNAIGLEEVPDAEVAAALVGKRAIATGPAVLGHRGQLSRLRSPSVEASPIPEEWRPGRTYDWSVALSAPGPDPEGIDGFTGEEVDDFLARLRG